MKGSELKQRALGWRERDISRSLVALVASLTALALLGLATTVPGWIGKDEGFVDVPPGPAPGLGRRQGGRHPGRRRDRLALLRRAAGQPRQHPAPADRHRRLDAVRRRGQRDHGCGRAHAGASDRPVRQRHHHRAGLPARPGHLLRDRQRRLELPAAHPADRVRRWGDPGRCVRHRCRRGGLAPQPRAADDRHPAGAAGHEPAQRCDLGGPGHRGGAGGLLHPARHRRRGRPPGGGPGRRHPSTGADRHPRLDRRLLPHRLVAGADRPRPPPRRRSGARGRLATWAAANASTASRCSASTPPRWSSRAPATPGA